MMQKLMILLAVVLMFSSCASYHIGVPLPENQRKICLSKVVNHTQEAALVPLFRNSFIQRLEGTPGVSTRASIENAEVSVEVDFSTLNQSGIADARIRDKRDRDSSSEEYQTVLYRYELNYSYTITLLETSEVLAKGTLKASADIPKMPDLELSRQSALHELSRSAAERLAAIITER